MTHEVNSLAFYLISLVIVFTAIYAVASYKLLNAALMLALCFFSIGGLYILLGAPFLGFLQILINAGAIPIMTVFIIMMTQSRISRMKSPMTAVVALLGLGALMVSIFDILVRFFPPANIYAAAANEVGVRKIGERLLAADGTLFPFEIVSVLLLVAMVGAIALAKREGETIKGEVGMLENIEPVSKGSALLRSGTQQQAQQMHASLQEGAD